MLPQRLRQHQREVAEPRHRAAHITEDDKLRLVHLPRPVVGDHRDPPVPSEARTVLRKSSSPSRPRRRRADSRTASRRASGATARRSSARSADCARRKSTWSTRGGSRSSRPCPGPSPPPSAGAPRPRSPTGRRPAARGRSAGPPARRAPPVPLGEQPGEQLGDQGVRRQRAQHPVAEERLPRRRGLPWPSWSTASRANRRRASSSPSMQQVQQLGTHQLGEVGVVRAGHVQRRLPRLAASPSFVVVRRRGRPVRQRPPQVEQHVVRRPLGGPLEQHRGQAVPELLAVEQVDDGQDLRGVHAPG